MNHRKTPNPKKVNIPVEISLVFLVFQTLMSCGNNEIVVNTAAIKPVIVMKSIFFCVLLFIWKVFSFLSDIVFIVKDAKILDFSLTVDGCFWLGRFK